MKFIAILLFSLLSISVCISQNWNGHYSYHNSIDTSTGNGKIFTASENAIYIYSTQDDQLNVITTIDGLSGDFISNIYYSPNFKDGSTERHDGLGFEIPRKYEIDVVYFNETPKQKFEIIEPLSITQEIPLEDKQTQNGKMLYRGNHQTEKQNLLNKMIESALALGAGALIDVKYQVFSTSTTTGYTFTGKAVRYVLK